jgi:AraC family transcriptional activator FtrA
MGFGMDVRDGLEWLRSAGLIIVPGIMDVRRPLPAAVVEALRSAHQRGAVIASICTGAFVLAAAGLLDGRRATTHWLDAELLSKMYPDTRVDPAVLYVDEGEILTSGGLAAGMDLCLHIVRRDYGPAVANTIARRLVMAPHREGGQAQFIERPVPSADQRGLGPTRAWILEHLSEPLTLASMAAHAHMSRRTFARQFPRETGVSAVRWVLDQRVLRARELLESTDFSVARIASQVGFGSALSLRQHFVRVLRTTPAAYRKTFRSAHG